ncbi:MAG: UDP-N-acetylmuramate--L-alanine ligase [Erysipelotrichaceae bacterium]|nr:UDP-N-acetylmuramate--L-alanine ligase [Erysipelotrichaceae bacterium]
MYYFIGIKGTGMAALACILHDCGNEVIGSDLERHFFTQEPLEERGITMLPFNPENIKDGMTVIIGNAFLEDFPEVIAARNNRSCTCFRYHEFLGHLMKDYSSIGVAGSHGKTTTTNMLETVLNEKSETGYLIGDGTGHLSPQCSDFVVEADEFRNHFLAYHPDYAIITNIDWDHIDFFPTLESYVDAYKAFCRQVSKAVVVYGEDPFAHDLKPECDILYYGTSKDDDIYADNIDERSDGMTFDVHFRGKFFGHFDLPFIGHHLLLNSLGVIGVAVLKGLSYEQIHDGLLKFRGAKRRFVVEEAGENVFIDDYAHHPTEIKVTLQAARALYPDRKIVAIFKPHRVSRVYYFIDKFVDAFTYADEVGVCEFTSIDDHDMKDRDIDISYLAERVPGSHIFHETVEDAKVLKDMAPAVYVFMSSKDIYPFKDKLEQLMNEDK